MRGHPVIAVIGEEIQPGVEVAAVEQVGFPVDEIRGLRAGVHAAVPTAAVRVGGAVM